MKSKNFFKGISILMSLMLCTLFIPNISFDTNAVDYNFCFPVNNGCNIAYYYGKTSDYGSSMHYGIDINKLSRKDDYIYAAYDGTVQAVNNSCPHHSWAKDHGISSDCGHRNSYGNSVYVNGTNGLFFIYGHLKQNSMLVKKGDKVVKGQPIAVMGDSGAATGKHLHLEVRTQSTGGEKYAINVNPKSKGGLITYSDGIDGKGKYLDPDPDPEYEPGVIKGKFVIKNVSTGTYMGVSGGKDADKTNVVVANNDYSSKFIMNVTAKNSNTQDGTSIMPGCSTTRVINGFADDVTDGTNVNLYKKTSDASQCWVWQKSGNNYVIRNAQHKELVLTVDGTNVLLKKYTGAKTQLWTVEDAKVLSSIAVTAPAKTSYYVGEKLNTTGMKVTATYSDKSTKDVTSSAKVTCDLSKAGEVTATVSYTEGSVSKSATFKVTVKEIPASPFKGEGTAESPYLISSKDDLKAFRDLVNDPGTNTKYGYAYYKQTADIDLENEEWIPIGKRMVNGVDWTYEAFYGNYDGDFHKITGLKVNETQKFAGLFGSLCGNAAVKNLHVEGNVTLRGTDEEMRSVGGITGEMSGTTLISDCSFTGNIESSSDAAGGIAGYMWNGGTITNCYHNGKVTGSGDAKNIGGIVGYCLVGSIENVKDISVKNSYHIGSVKTANGNSAGSAVGLIAFNEKYPANIYIDNVYVNSDDAVEAVNGTATSSNIYIVTEKMLKDSADDLGASFTNNDNSNINNGFPVFPWEVQQAQTTTTTTDAVPVTTTTTTTAAKGTESDIIGDANVDGKVSVADAVAILQFIGNRDKYQLTAHGLKNADVDGVAGITGKDALVLQQVDAGLVNAEDLPLKK